MSDTLLAYYSQSGVTERLAIQLATRLGADLLSVKAKTPRTGNAGYLTRAWRFLLRQKAQVEHNRDPADYAVVIIGSSVRGGRLSTPMRSYLEQLHSRIGAAAAFWVSGSRRADIAVSAEIEKLIGVELLTTVSFSEDEVNSGVADAKVEAMAQVIRRHLPRAEINQ